MIRRRTVPAYAPANDLPISALNTTPLIDVMLVLLIMFIITIPMTTHKVPLDLPSGPPPVEAPTPVIHRLDLDAAGRIRLDGQATSQAALPAALRAIAAEPASDLLLHADGETRYEPFDQVMAIIKRAGITRLGMVDNEKFVAALD